MFSSGIQSSILQYIFKQRIFGLIEIRGSFCVSVSSEDNVAETHHERTDKHD